MADKIIENNQVSIMGKIDTGFTFSHQVFGEGFYTMEILVRRLSDSEDRIPVMVSERLLDVTQDYTGEYIEIQGQFRSYNRHEEKHNRLVLSVFARELKFVEEDEETVPLNQIFLDGYICKPPVYRRTPLGREIADMLLAVNRPYGKSDGQAGYVSCSQPSVWQVGLHTMYLLGQKCAICFGFHSRRTCTSVGKNPEPRIHETYRGKSDREADRL